MVDTRRFGDKVISSQTANLAANIQHKTRVNTGVLVSGASASWNINDNGLSVQTYKLGASYKYNHQRVFNVVGLRYTLAVDVSKYQTNSLRSKANLRDSYSIDQKLEYAIGRTHINLNVATIKKAKEKYTFMVIRVERTFG